MQMNQEKLFRRAVISDNLFDRLNLYLGFRHFFRHSYAFQLKWGKMKDIAADIEKTFKQFEDEIICFTESL